MYKRALVALDGSQVAETIMPFILEIAGPLELEVTLVRVNVPVRPTIVEGAAQPMFEDPEAARVDAEEYLASLNPGGVAAFLDVPCHRHRSSALVSGSDGPHASCAPRFCADHGRCLRSGAHAGGTRESDVSWAVWITGPPASGKTAMACAAADLLHARGEPVRVLELDAIRSRLIPDSEYTETERELVYRSLAYVAAKLTEAGVPVIVDATAHRRRWREFARAAIQLFAEVQLLCPVDVCRERERTRIQGHPPSGIYSRAGSPGATVPGVDVPYEPALAPELAIDTTRDDVAAGAAAIASLAERLASGTSAGRKGMTRWAIWITGRPGSGKTTLTRRIAELLATELVPIAVLDLASARRFVVGREWATDRQEEVVHRTLALTAQLLTEAGVAVILDATATRRAWRELAREWIAHFAEVQLVCPAEICAERERATRWHLGAARFDGAGPLTATPDIALDYEESLCPELRLFTHVPDLKTSVEEVLQLAKRLERTATARSTDKERSIT